MNCRIIIPFLVLFLLTDCALVTTTHSEPTNAERNSTIAQEIVSTTFQVGHYPNYKDPDMEIFVKQDVSQEETFQRQYVVKRSMKRGARKALWLDSAILVIYGYRLMTRTGWVILGKDLIGIGILLSLGPEVGVTILNAVKHRWKEEKRLLPTKEAPAAFTPLVAKVGSQSWTIHTDSAGSASIDISSLVHQLELEPDEPLSIDIALKEDPAQRSNFSLPSDVIALIKQSTPLKEIPADRMQKTSTDLETSKTLAILDFEGIGVPAQEARILTNRLGTYMVQLRSYQVIERGQMEEILAEQDFQLTGCTSNECAVEIGQLLGVQQMLAGSFGKLGTVYTIDMRIIDVLTGRITKTTSYDIEGSINLLLTEGLAEAVRRIAGSN